MASIHTRGAKFVHPNYTPNAADHRSKSKSHDAPKPYPWGMPFWATIVGTPTEVKLARMMGAKVRGD